MKTTNTTTIINGIELNTNFDGYLFSYSSDNDETNITIPEEGIVLLESMIKLGKAEFNKTMHRLTSKSSKVYNILYNMKEVSYVNNPYDVLVFHCIDLKSGKINKDNLVNLIKKIDPSTKLMEEDFVLNRRLFFAIITLISKYNGMTVDRHIQLPGYVVRKCLAKMKKDNFRIKIENGYEYVRDIIKEVLKNK